MSRYEPTIDDQEEQRLAQIENEVERTSRKVFKDVEFLGIKDEYFDEQPKTFNDMIERQHGTTTKSTEL